MSIYEIFVILTNFMIKIFSNFPVSQVKNGAVLHVSFEKIEYQFSSIT